MLGGGFGFTSRTQGTLSDTLVRTDVITASGDMLTCDSSHNSDLFWACRGGPGGSFGINTSYTLQTHPLPEKVSVYKIDRPWSEAPKMLAALQRMMLHRPRRAGMPDRPRRDPAEAQAPRGEHAREYVGPVGRLREPLAPVIAAAKPTAVEIKEVPIARGVQFLAADVPFDRFAAKSSYALEPSSDAAIATLIRELDRIPGSTNRVAPESRSSASGARSTGSPRTRPPMCTAAPGS